MGAPKHYDSCKKEVKIKVRVKLFEKGQILLNIVRKTGFFIHVKCYEDSMLFMNE